jgi:excisionase family DNA binding protein
MNSNKDQLIQSILDDLISLQEAAEYSGLSASHIRLLVRSGEVAGKKVGRNWITTKQAMNDYLALGRKRGPKPQ